MPDKRARRRKPRKRSEARAAVAKPDMSQDDIIRGMWGSQESFTLTRPAEWIPDPAQTIRLPHRG